ncbi:MAG: hypothetical protein Q8878_03135 [Bacillota bacterium]|nr:hypothetical protein [Bacillota bacterium]
MKYKIATVAFLIAALMVSVTAGTLSCFSSASESEIGITPDSKKIEKRYEEYQKSLVEQQLAEQKAAEQQTAEQQPAEQQPAEQQPAEQQPVLNSDTNPNPSENLAPDMSKAQENADVIGDTNVSGDGNVANEKGFVVITGDVKQENKDASLDFGKEKDKNKDYILYFEPGSKIQFADGETADMSGFYTINSGKTDIFDKSLYEETKNGLQPADDNGELKVCEDIAKTCDKRDIPLEVTEGTKSGTQDNESGGENK